MFTIDIWFDTFLQSYSNTHQSYQVLRMTSYHRISTNPLMRDSLTSIFAEQYIKSLLKNTSTTLLVERYESCLAPIYILITHLLEYSMRTSSAHLYPVYAYISSLIKLIQIYICISYVRTLRTIPFSI